MRNLFFCVAAFMVLSLAGCAPIETILSHGFNSDYYNLKTVNGESSIVYADVYTDSVVIYPLKNDGSKIPDPESGQGTVISTIMPGNLLYGSRFVKTSVDFDLSTIITKVRLVTSGVPVQLNSTVNGVLYLGIRRDFYSVRSHKTILNNTNSFIRQLGYDAGFFAGIGMTPVNPTVTNDNISLEYDGVVFQKGIAAFITLDNISVGVALGFDNLLGDDSRVWVYNNRPYVGLVLGIANF